MRSNLAAIMALLSIIGVAAAALAQHQAQGQSNASQNYISHPDVALTANAAPVGLLGANPARITAVCQMVGTIGSNTARLGDASIGPSQGTQLSAAIPAAAFDVTGGLYGFSATGATVNCSEVARP
jgi:hypothetical protein